MLKKRTNWTLPTDELDLDGSWKAQQLAQLAPEHTLSTANKLANFAVICFRWVDTWGYVIDSDRAQSLVQPKLSRSMIHQAGKLKMMTRQTCIGFLKMPTPARTCIVALVTAKTCSGRPDGSVEVAVGPAKKLAVPKNNSAAV